MTKMYKSLPSSVRLMIIIGAAAVFLVGTILVALADAVGPTLGNFTPAPNTDITQTSAFWLKVSFTANDPDGIDGSSVQLKLNGQSVSASYLKVTYPQTGHWEQVWNATEAIWEWIWVSDGYDYTQATIEGQFWVNPSTLPDKNIVWVSVADKQGNVSTDQWTLNRNANPTISNLTPANGASVSSALPTISAMVTDNGTIDETSTVLKIDGAIVNHTFDSSTGIVSFTPSAPLAAGRHDVYLGVKDTAENTASASWYFTVLAGTASFSSATPTPGSTINVCNPDISVVVTDIRSLNKYSLVVIVNGKKVPATITLESIVKGTISYKPDMLLDDINTVAVSIANSSGAVSSYSWAFDVKAPPKITEPSPADGTEVSTTTPTISAKVTENGSSLASVSMLVNGAAVAASFNPTNSTVSYTPSTPLTNDTTYTVGVTAVDGAGLLSSLTWKFTVQTLQDMPVSSNCADCHQGYPVPNHPMTNCNGCHGGGTPIADCRLCHVPLQHGPEYLTRLGGHYYWEPRCDWCHNSTYSYKIPTHPENLSEAHTSTADMSACKECHSSSLTREHYRRVDVNGNNYTCATCHSSTRAEVKAAIESGNKDCGACHTSAGSHEAQHASTLEATCITCHKDNLVQEHVNNRNLTCDTCHGSTRSEVQTAIANGQTNCSACHPSAGNHEALHTTTVLDAKCTTCHINSLTQEHLNNTKTQTQTLTCTTCHASTRQDVTGAIATSNKHCAACHQQGHNMSFSEPKPSDIPLYSGFRWSAPLDAGLWAGESWMPNEFTTGKVLISNRRTDVTGDDVWSFYQTGMSTNGWTLASSAPAAGSNFYSVTFTKDTRKAIIWFYGGEDHKASSPVVSSGYRIEILYK